MSISKNVKRWAFYSFANHSYQVVYVAFILPIFFSTAFANYNLPLSAWGFATGVSTLFGIFLAIIIGKYSDSHSKLHAYKWSIILTGISMLAMAISSVFSALALYWLFIVTNIFFIWSLALYDSILPHLSDDSTVYEYGGFAWGFGYVGGVVSLLIALIFQYLTGNYSVWVFLCVPIFYFIFSLYSISGLEGVSFKVDRATPAASVLPKKRKVILLLGYWLISECVTVIGLFAVIYFAVEMHFSTMQTGIVFLLVQLIGFPATWYGGRLTKKFDSLKLLGVTILGWGVALSLLVLAHLNFWELGIVIVVMGLVYGNSQSYLRSQYATVIDKSESGLQFGIYSFISEASVVVGPIIYGYASDKLHSQKIPMLGLFVLMALGYSLVYFVIRNIKTSRSSLAS